MIWLELRKNNRNYNQGWNFTQSVWAPTLKKDGSKWPFWYLINDVKKNDIILHLQNIAGSIHFSGYSSAIADSYTTQAKPTTEKHEWDFIDSFFKVDLHKYKKFQTPIPLASFFHTNDQQLRDYFLENKILKKYKKRLFYVIQRQKLQCLNGAYFSEFDENLSDLLIEQIDRNPNIEVEVETSESLSYLKTRIGHRQFAENVKRNFNYQCCFPKCKIKGRGFLVSGHITRWADNIELRGETKNGLSFCLLHDKAFEKGYFTLDSRLNISVIKENLEDNSWLTKFLNNGNLLRIKHSHLNPTIEALEGHWLRIGYSPRD